MPLLLLLSALLFSPFPPTLGSPPSAYQTQSNQAPEIEGWPREIVVPEGRILIYQPQVETLKENDLSGRAAVSVHLQDAEAPIFGAVWFVASVETDREERMVYVHQVKVPRVRFPESTPEQEVRLASILEKDVPTWELSLSLDRVLVALENIEDERTAAENLETAAPQILFRTGPSVLIMIDGEPELRQVENSSLMYVINTPFLIVLDPSSKSYFLYAGKDAWYKASEITGTWAFTENIPADIQQLAPDESGVELPEPEDEDNTGTIPSIIVATQPTELLYTDGEPTYAPISSTDLMYVSNSDSDLFLDIDTQDYYVLLSGRWYKASALEGPWDYVAADALPDSFSDIPSDSEIGDIRVHVAGTEEASEAVLDAQIPQTAQVNRDTTSVTITYDGTPQFESIEGTSMEYAINTSSSVIKADGKYWACEEAVWFVANQPEGPWAVATTRPEDVEAIPASNPTFNVKYVYIYDVTPEVVYVGYTPGYTNSYVYGPTIVYGTGYWYRPWYGQYYYPRPATWGYHVRWNPWYGWSFGVTYSNGWFTFGIGLGGWHPWYGGWWGPAGYHGYWRGYHRGYYHGWHHGYYHGARAGYRAGYRAGARAGYRNNNLYRTYDRPGVKTREARPSRDGNRTRPAASTREARPTRDGDRTRPGASTRDAASTRNKNNLYTDREGNVHRRNNNGSWDSRNQNGWSPTDRTRPQTNDQVRPKTNDRVRPQTNDRTRQLERDYQSRQRGTQRSNNYQRSRSSQGANRSRSAQPRRRR